MSVYHIYSSFDSPDPATVRRQAVAQKTWARQPWTEVAVRDAQLPRAFADGGQHLPFIKDLIDQGRVLAHEADILILTNADICVRTDATVQIVAQLQDTDACFCYRRDFHHDFDDPIPDHDIHKGAWYPGMDLFAFRAGWWTEVRDEYPDMLLGREAWDSVMKTLMILTCGDANATMNDVIYHQRHYSKWEDGGLRYKIPSQRHNIGLAKQWFAVNGVDFRQFGLR